MHVQISNTFDLYNHLVSTRTRLPTNLFYFHSPGHWYIELDNLLRMLRLNEHGGARCLLVLPDRPQCHVMARLYGHRFHMVVIDDRLFDMAREISVQFPELTIDVGLSNFKHHLPDREHRPVGSYRGKPVIGLSVHELHGLQAAYYRRYAATRDHCPLAEGLPPLPDALAAFLGEGRERMALLQIKLVSGNATGSPTDAATYLPTVRFLTEAGYTPVLIGREPMPDALRACGVIDYAGSPLASFENDILLLRHAKFSLFCGSGLGLWGSVSGHPFLYANHWHLMWPPPSRLCVGVPARLVEKATGRALGFREQIALITDPRSSGGGLTVPLDRFDCLNASAEELLDATREAVALGAAWTPRSAEQEAFSRLDGGCLAHADGRLSQAFLERHAALLS